MATTTLTISEAQTFCYPPISYGTINGYYEWRNANTWYYRHSDPDRFNRCYQAGNSTSDGQYNGNMMSHFLFKNGSQTLNQFIKSIGGSSKITKISLTVTCGHAYYSTMDLKICMGYAWDTVSKYRLKTADSYSGLGIDKMVEYTIPKGATRTIDLTAHKAKFDSGQTICIYAPGAYNKDYYAYGWLYGHKGSTEAQKPKLTIEYTTNAAPNKPGLTIHSASDSNGYYVPNLDFTLVSNGDPDNNLDSKPHAYEFYNASGGRIYSSTWYSATRHSYNLSSYRGQSIRARSIIRDNKGLTNYTDKTIYINSKPYWNGHGAESNAITFSSGVTNGVYQDNITISWPKATDAQSQHASNLRYHVYAQIGTDKGPSGDTEANKIASSLTSTSYTFDARSIKGTSVAKGDRIYLSVWVHDGLEWSDNRLVSSWIYRETPPSAPTNVAPTSGHYESSVEVSWSESSAQQGTTIKHYQLELLNSSGSTVRTYTTTSTSYTCNDLSLIERGRDFKFKVTAINNLGSASTAAYSGTLKRNSAPTDPKNFKVNNSSLYVKNSVPLTWIASTDADGDTVKYNLYYSINNGTYQELVKGLTTTSYEHDIRTLTPGTSLNYYIEAYDTFNVFSNKVYIAARPQVNTPPKAPVFSLPISGRTLYTNVPRIVFQTKESYNGNDLVAIVNVNGREYRSDTDISCFDKIKYPQNSQGMFMIPDATPLKYINNNSLTIKAFDGLDMSTENSMTIPCEAVVVSNKNKGDLITAEDINSVKAMINVNRFAYGLSQTSWYDGNMVKNKTFVYKKYFDQAVDSIYELNNMLNQKTTSNSLKRNYTKVTNTIIDKTIMNNMLNIIKKS